MHTGCYIKLEWASSGLHLGYKEIPSLLSAKHLYCIFHLHNQCRYVLTRVETIAPGLLKYTLLQMSQIRSAQLYYTFN